MKIKRIALLFVAAGLSTASPILHAPWVYERYFGAVLLTVEYAEYASSVYCSDAQLWRQFNPTGLGYEWIREDWRAEGNWFSVSSYSGPMFGLRLLAWAPTALPAIRSFVAWDDRVPVPGATFLDPIAGLPHHWGTLYIPLGGVESVRFRADPDALRPTPEPATIFLLGVGLTCLALAKLRK